MHMKNMSGDIIKLLQSLSGKYSVYEIFANWVQMMALSFAQAVWYEEKRETEYKEIVNRYTQEELAKLFEATAYLWEWAEQEMTDMLGYIYMHLDLGSKSHGQFFTPYHICKLMAKIPEYEEGLIKVNEPTCGAGGNIIALAEALKDKGLNYQQIMRATLQDIDTKAVYMSYVQMCIYGIPAVVFQSDTLQDPNGNNSSTGRLYSVGYLLTFA